MREQETGDRQPATGNRQPAMQLGANISERLLEFGVTGAGANYEEARAAESRADFVHKVGIAAKEAREASYWIGLVQRSGWFEDDLRALVGEANELAAILGASARTAKSRAHPK